MKRSHWFILPEAFPILAAGLILTILVYLLFNWQLAIIPGIFILFSLYFFRNPQRKIVAQPNEILSPADGVIMSIEEVKENNYLLQPAIRVSIFLSIFNVHVNRCPIEGTVEYVHYREGQFLPAFKSHASEINERNYLGLKSSINPAWRILVVQITGFIARRIVCWTRVGQQLKQGQRFGMIKFGSCTELYLPLNSEILVTKGQKVRGGMTVIGRLQDG